VSSFSPPHPASHLLAVATAVKGTLAMPSAMYSHLSMLTVFFFCAEMVVFHSHPWLVAKLVCGVLYALFAALRSADNTTDFLG
jgi:hypothetical protein